MLKRLSIGGIILSLVLFGICVPIIRHNLIPGLALLFVPIFILTLSINFLIFNRRLK